MITVPNILTFVRILLAPAFVAAYVAAGGPGGTVGLLRLSAGIFIVAFVLDVLDGLFARALRQVSGLGIFLDPLADKLLIATALVLMLIYRSLPPWIVGVVMGRDVLISGGWLVLRRYGLAPQIRPSRVGKTALASQVIAIVATIIGLSQPIWWVIWAAALLLTTISGVNYAYRGLQYMRKHRRTTCSSQSSRVA